MDDELQRAAHKFERESDSLIRQLDHLMAESPEIQVDIALSTAKRVRRQSNLLVRLLASLRDNHKLQH